MTSERELRLYAEWCEDFIAEVLDEVEHQLHTFQHNSPTNWWKAYNKLTGAIAVWLELIKEAHNNLLNKNDEKK